MSTTSVPTDQQILDQLRIAMHAIALSEHAQHTVNGQTFTKLNLDTLTSAITYYQTRVDRAARGGVFGVLRNGGPSG